MFLFLSYRKNFVGTKNPFGICYGKRAIGVRTIEVPLYYIQHSWFCQQLFHGTGRKLSPFVLRNIIGRAVSPDFNAGSQKL